MAAALLSRIEKPSPVHEVGRRIAGRYLIEGVLGQGGMGTVYSSLDERNGRRVALKRLHQTHLERRPVLATFFRREYHTLKQLAHPGIVEVHDFGIDELGLYYTMELLSGSDLAHLAPMPWQQVCAILRDVASSLALIHSRQLLHRDVSPRNVRCSAGGQAKLIDFGALTSIGVSGEVIGTPPFVAPEAVNRQALDARTDLYSLGALGYWLLTGRNAYPARSLQLLRDAWRSRPTPICALAREVPPALESLMFSLLSLDPMARPASASEVIERLIAIGDLAVGDALAAARCYLSTPSLVARGEELLRFRKRVLRATRGRGGAALIEAQGGMGRTRLIQAVELEGRLAGATVLHASGASAGAGHCATILALANALFELQPELARAEAEPEKGILGYASAELHARLGHCELAQTGLALERPGLVQRALCEWLLRVSRERCLVIEVDDAERADEGSLRALAALAQRARTSRLALVVVVGSGASALGADAIAAIRRNSAVVTLGPLDAPQCQALVRSVFGDVPNLKAVADWVFGLSEGNPRSSMELMQHMVDRGIVRYEHGAFVLPATLREHDLPSSLGEAMDRCLAALKAEARELAQVLALSETPLVLPEYALALGLDPQRADDMFSAIDALVGARVLVMDKDAYGFRQQGHAEAARRSIPEGRQRELLLRLARIFELRGDQPACSTYLLRAGEELKALTTMIPYLEQTSASIGLATAPVLLDGPSLTPFNEDTTKAVRIRERLLEVCARHDRPARESFMIRGGLLYLANRYDMSLMRGHVEKQLDELSKQTGAIYWEQSDPSLLPLERIQGCLARAQVVYDKMNVTERVLSPLDAVGALLMNVGVAQSYGRQAYEVLFLRDLVAMSGLFQVLSSSHRSSYSSVVHALEQVTGRYERAAELRAELLEHYGRMIATGRTMHGITLIGCVIMMQYEGVYRSMRGGESGFDWAQRLEGSRNWPWLPNGQPLPTLYANHWVDCRAWEIRRLAHLFSGNADGARACLEPIERLSMQRPFSAYGGGIAFFEAQAYAMSGDLMGVKQSVETIAAIVERQYPGWSPFLHTVRGDYHRLRAELDVALVEYERALEQTSAGRHAAWSPAAAGRSETLLEQGKTEQALAWATQALEQCERAELGPTAARDLVRVLALAEAHAGNHLGGAARLEQLIEREKQLGLAGLALGVLYEARARIALVQDDAAGFQTFAQLTAAQYRPGCNPALIAKYERLVDSARNREFVLSSQLLHAVTPESELATDPERDARTQLEQSTGAEDRSRRALGLLIEQTRAEGGLLYILDQDGIRLVASIGTGAPPAQLESALRAYLAAELDGSSEVTETCFDRQADVSGVTSSLGRWQPVVLTRSEDARRLVIGIAALVAPDDRALAADSVMSAVSDLLRDTNNAVSVYAAG